MINKRLYKKLESLHIEIYKSRVNLTTNILTNDQVIDLLNIQ